MPPKQQISREKIIDAAFKICRKEGMNSLSARSVAESLNVSTSPIYSCFKSMDELKKEVYARGIDLKLQYETTPRTGSPLIDIGLGYILFAVREKQLFRDMFMNIDELGKDKKKLLGLAVNRLESEMGHDQYLENFDAKQLKDLQKTGWFYIHGIASLLNINAVDRMTEEEIIQSIKNIALPYLAFAETTNKKK